jgi:hypothetical protein
MYSGKSLAVGLQNMMAGSSRTAPKAFPGKVGAAELRRWIFQASVLLRPYFASSFALESEWKRRGPLLRISVDQDQVSACFLLEGRLVGPWVDEVRRVWRQAVDATDRLQLVVDLHGVTSMDTRGQRLLEELLQHGATLRCSDVMNRYLVEQMGVSGRLPETCRPCRRFTTQSDAAAAAAETELAS